MPEATPERTVDEKLVRRLLAEQFPGLGIVSLAPFAEGFDNVLWLVNGGQVFRFPRREAALPGLAREIALLPHLAGLVPVPVPRPEWVGRPSEGFPWPFFGSRLLPGRESSEAGLDDEARERPSPSRSGGSCGRCTRPRRWRDSRTPGRCPTIRRGDRT
jgi:aminoglycoside phosphotransferase (APT) family kinase protein